MSNSWRIARRILAVLGGFVFLAVLSTLVDFALEKTVWPGLARADVSTPVWIFVTFYRAVISIAGCYVAAWLAPDKPMAHAIALGILGVIVSTLGLFAMWGIGPMWYPIALIAIALPCGWIGGRLYTAYNPA